MKLLTKLFVLAIVLQSFQGYALASKTDLLFVISCTIKSNFYKMQSFLKKTLTDLDIDSGATRVSIAVVDHKEIFRDKYGKLQVSSNDIQFQLNNYSSKVELNRAIDNMVWPGQRDQLLDDTFYLNDLLDTALQYSNGNRKDAKDVLVLVTDKDIYYVSSSYKELYQYRIMKKENMFSRPYWTELFHNGNFELGTQEFPGFLPDMELLTTSYGHIYKFGKKDVIAVGPTSQLITSFYIFTGHNLVDEHDLAFGIAPTEGLIKTALLSVYGSYWQDFVYSRATSLAVDWIGYNIYWVEEFSGIRVSDIKGNKIAILQAVTDGKQIFLDSRVAVIFYTSGRQLIKMNMDGTESQVIDRDDLTRTYGPLAIDYINSKLYAIKSQKIIQFNYDGNRKISITRITRPVRNFLVDNARLVLLDFNGKITTCNKSDCSYLYYIHSSPPVRAMATPNRDIQTAKRNHPCRVNGSLCSDLCLLSPMEPFYRCYCSDNFVLDDDNRTCNPVLFSGVAANQSLDRNDIDSSIYIISPENIYESGSIQTPAPNIQQLPFRSREYSNFVILDPIEKWLIWIEYPYLYQWNIKDSSQSKIKLEDDYKTSHTDWSFENCYSDWIYRTIMIEIGGHTSQYVFRKIIRNYFIDLRNDSFKIEKKGRLSVHGTAVIAFDTFHRKLYFYIGGRRYISENQLDMNYGSYETRRYIDVPDHVVRIEALVVDAKDGCLFYVTFPYYRIYSLRIDEGQSKLLLDMERDFILGFTSYGQDLYWIEKSVAEPYKIMTLPKKNGTKPKTLFTSKDVISAIVVSEIKDSNNTDKWSDDVSKCVARDGSWIPISKGMICDGQIDCYDRFDEYYCCYENSICGIRKLQIQCIDAVGPTPFFNNELHVIDLPFSKFLSELLSFRFCRFRGHYIDNFGLERKLIVDYTGKSHMYRQLTAGDVFNQVWRVESMELVSILSLKETMFLNFSSLNKLLIRKTLLKVIEYDAFHGLKNLSNLTISENKNLQVIDKDAFISLLNLENLNLSHNAITDFHSDTFGSLIPLRTIDLRGNNFYFTNTYFRQDLRLAVIYADSYIICCMKPPSVTDENCKTPKDAITGCENLIKDEILKIFLWVIGIIALFGNIAVIVFRVFGVEKTKNKTFILFVTNLTLSDGLMGIYMMIIAVHDLKYTGIYTFNAHTWKNSFLCYFSGTVSFVSSEASVLFIFFITIDRFLAVKYPIGGPRITKKIAYAMTLFTWIISSVTAIIPGQIYPGFYSYSGVCLALPITSDIFDGQFYSVAVFLGFNFLTFILIAVGQYIIFREIKLSSRRVRSRLTPRDREAATMLLMVVITDCFCWIPVGVLIIVSQAGFKVPDVMYAWIVVFVLPINSAINPFLYTLVPEIRKWIARRRHRIAQTRNQTPNANTTNQHQNKSEIEMAVRKVISTDDENAEGHIDKTEDVSPNSEPGAQRMDCCENNRTIEVEMTVKPTSFYEIEIAGELIEPIDKPSMVEVEMTVKHTSFNDDAIAGANIKLTEDINLDSKIKEQLVDSCKDSMLEETIGQEDDDTGIAETETE